MPLTQLRATAREAFMGNASSVTNLPPNDGQQVLSKPRVTKVLVVQADYFALTSRRDANVIFWKANEAQAPEAQIPKKVTHLWLAAFVSDGTRASLLSQAKEREIEVWDCTLSELRRRLLAVWADDTNRSIIDPVDPDLGVVSGLPDLEVSIVHHEPSFDLVNINRSRIDALASRTSEFEEHEEEDSSEEEATPRRRRKRILTLNDKFLIERMKKLRKAARKFQARKNGKVVDITTRTVRRKSSRPQPATPTKELQPPNVVATLQKLPDLDRMVYSMVHGLTADHQPIPPSKVAVEFGLPESLINRIVERVRQKLVTT